MEEGVALLPVLGRVRVLRSLGRHHGHVDGRLADHRPDAGRRALSQWRLVLRRLQGDAGVRLVLRASDRHATSRTTVARAYRLDRFATGAADRRKGRRRPTQPALRAHANHLPPLRRPHARRVHVLGDATVRRPLGDRSPTPSRRSTTTSTCATIRRPARELWYHRRGCHSGWWSSATRATTRSRAPRAARGLLRGAGEAPSELAASRRAAHRPPAAVRFSFDGQDYSGYAGDTLASALLANDVRLVGRSFKYHRPRGILTAGPEEPNALVELRSGARREPNTRATTVELYDGLEATSQNRWPSLQFDLLAITGCSRRCSSRASTTRPSCGRPPSGKRSTSR